MCEQLAWLLPICPSFYITVEETANPEMKKKAQGRLWKKKDENFFIKVADTRHNLWYDSDSMVTNLLWGCGCSGGGSPSAYLFASLCYVVKQVNTILQG